MSTKPATLPAPNAAGAMEFTKRFLRAKNPCANGFRWFVRHVEDGASYQEALDTLVQAGRVEDACWLLTPDGHPKLLHCWPVKLLQAGRGDYAGSEVMIRRAAASLSL